MGYKKQSEKQTEVKCWGWIKPWYCLVSLIWDIKFKSVCTVSSAKFN